MNYHADNFVIIDPQQIHIQEIIINTLRFLPYKSGISNQFYSYCLVPFSQHSCMYVKTENHETYFFITNLCKNLQLKEEGKRKGREKKNLFSFLLNVVIFMFS